MNISQAEIRNILQNADIEGLIQSGAPQDEYNSEADLLVESLAAFHDEDFTGERVASVLAYIWCESFNLSEEDISMRRPLIEQAASDIVAAKM